jgi:peptidoglycan/xylan/chitin deacetylase (PgdA/CDA1 family)
MTVPAERSEGRSVLDPILGRRPPFVLMYHRVAVVSHDPNVLVVSPERFAEQMAWLARRRLRGVSTGELIEAVRAGDHRQLVGITFDDGYADLADHVPAVLHRHGFTATVFVVSGRLGGVNDWDGSTPWPLVNADGVRRLVDAGLEIGSHGRHHVALAGMDPIALRDETDGSRRDLEALLGAPVRGFAYPYGSMDAAARAAVRESGYAYGCAVFAARRDQSVMALPRFYAGERDGRLRLAAKRLLYSRHVAKAPARR